MSLMPRPSRVRGLMDDPAFSQRIFDRIRSCLDVKDTADHSIIDLHTDGIIPLGVLQEIVVIRIGPGEPLAARVELAESGDGACRLTLLPWMGFVNRDATQPVLEQGIHLWLNAAWRHLPLTT